MSNIIERVKSKQDKSATALRSIERLIQLYTDKSHFIYELLQNAEDAGATIVRFLQYNDRLEVLHNGRPFTDDNLDALCDVGKSDKTDKTENLNQIGEFGVGFKSVFGICKTVELYSDPSHYTGQFDEIAEPFAVSIINFTDLESLPNQAIPTEFTTRYVFPYAVGENYSNFMDIESLIKTLSEKLQNLGISALLFMKSLSAIEYKIDTDGLNCEGTYTLEKEKLSERCIRVSASGKTAAGGENVNESIQYLLFTRPLKGSMRSVDIAFSVVMKDDGSYECVRSTDPYISVYFPTETESKLDFIVQGPYRTTPDRGRIPADHPDNIALVAETAYLLKSSILDLKKMGVFDLSFMRILPIDPEKFNYYGLFLPLLDAVKEVFRTFNLLPCEFGDYTSWEHAKIAGNTEMLQLFDDNKLSSLINDGQNYRWLSACFTESTDEDRPVYEFLVNELGVERISLHGLCNYFVENQKFLCKQDDSWLVALYSMFESYPDAFDDHKLLTCPIVKTSKGKFVSAYKHDNSNKLIENVFIEPKQTKITGLSFVDASLYVQCHRFFDEILQLEEPDEYEIMIRRVKKHFKRDYRQYNFIERQHIEDIKFLLKYAGSGRFVNPRVEEIHDVLEDRVVLLCIDGTFHHPSDIYASKSEDGIDIQHYLHNAVFDINFIDTEFYASHKISIADLGILGVHVDLLCNEETSGTCYSNGEIVSRQKEKGITREVSWSSKGAFRWNLTLDHIEDILRFISHNPDADSSIWKSKIIMDCLFNNEEKLQGYVKINGETPNLENEPCLLIRQLCSNAYIQGWDGKWLYNQSCELVAPDSITCHDLNTDIYGRRKKNSIVYKLLRFAKSDLDTVEEVSQSLTAPQRDVLFNQMLKQRFGLTSEDISYRLNISAQPERSEFLAESEYLQDEFPVGKVRNWETIRKHAAEMLLYADPVRYEKKFRSIRTSNNSTESRAYLINMYSLDKTNDFACQMCHQARPNMASVELFNEPDLELDPLHLCLCLNCRAKYIKFRNQDDTMRQLQYDILNIEQDEVISGDQVKIPIFDEEIWFTQTHFAEIQELLKLKQDAQEYAGKSSNENFQMIYKSASGPYPSENKMKQYQNGRMNKRLKRNIPDKNNTSDKIQCDSPEHAWLIGKRISRESDGLEGKVIAIQNGIISLKNLKGAGDRENTYIKIDRFLEQKDKGVYVILD